MPDNSREVYEFFRNDQDPQDAVSLLAYAVFEEEKYEWMAHRKKTTGHYPTIEEIDKWISELPQQNLQRIYDRAFRWMDEFAHNLLADEMEADRNRAIQQSVASELRKQGRFGRQIAIGTIAGLISAVAFAIILYVIAVSVFADVSPVGLAKDALRRGEETR